MLLANILVALALLGTPEPESTTTEIIETTSFAGWGEPDLVVLFDPKSHELDELAELTLEYLADALRNSDSMICMWLVGQCDPETDGANCENLAASRVEEVTRFLVDYGVDSNLVAPFPQGRKPPPCDYQACRVSKRRVFLMSPGQGDCRLIPQ